VARHLGVLGVLWVIFSGLRLIPGLTLIGLVHFRFPFMFAPIPAPMRLFLTPFLAGIGVLLSGYAIAGMIAGIGLLAHSPWARMLTIVLGCISLIHFPLGTALGIYTLWVLVPEGADNEYKALARAN
jgi:urea transporter